MATVEILTIPLGSQLTSTINKRTDPPEPDSKNDFPVLFLFSENVTGLTESDITVSVVDSANRAVSGASVVSLEGTNSVWMAKVRPPEGYGRNPQNTNRFLTTGVLTVTVAANAVAEGNPRTSKNIRISTSFPDTDAETPTELFRRRSAGGIAVSPTRILLSRAAATRSLEISKFTHAGVEQTGEQQTAATSSNISSTRLDYINGDLLVGHVGRYDADLNRIGSTGLSSQLGGGITHSRLGITAIQSGDIISTPYGETERITQDVPSEFSTATSITHQNSLLYLARNTGGYGVAVAEIQDDDTINFLKKLNINTVAPDISIYRDTLYILRDYYPRTQRFSVETVNIRKYRPVARNTKTTIYPVFANAGDTIDLKQFSPDAERIVFDFGYDKPSYLSINASNKLVIGSDAQTCLVKLKAINRMDATETGSFGFYLIIRQAGVSPVWRNVSELTMRVGSNYDLFQLVPDAESIAFRSGRTRLAGSSLSNGIFKIGTVGGIAAFTATKGSQSAHIEITIDVVQGIGVRNPSDGSQASGYRVEIGGLDVTADVLEFPSVSETLDPVIINEYRVNEASITLRNESGKYNSNLDGNFWETNGLNAGGFQNSVKIWIIYSDGRENLHFSGLINESFVPIKGMTFKLNCVDISSRLRKAFVQGFGTLEKWDALRKQSDEDSYEGVYVPERSLGPMQVRTGKARSGRTDLDISQLELPSEGPAAVNTGYMTPNEFRTAGGFLSENPLLGFMGVHRSEDVRFLINQLAINKEVYNTEIDIPGVSADTPFLLNRGSIAFSIERTRTTRLPVDWVYDSSNNRLLILLSNPETHLLDLLVQYDMDSDAYRTLHTFDKGVAVHRIERRSGTHYYILTSKKIPQDRSARALPRQTDVTGYGYDSLAKGSEIRIWHYNASTNTLTEHVASNNARPPQLGIHYWVGFENDLYIDEFEGIRPGYRGAFKWYNGNLYYRYAKDGEFGVARANASGITSKMIGQAIEEYHNHLNFAFDINSSGSIYFVYGKVNPPRQVTVVNNASLRNSPATISDNLSSYSVPLQLSVTFTTHQGFHDRTLSITGIDANGDTQTTSVRPSGFGSQTRTINGTFLRVTQVSPSRFTNGSFSIQTVSPISSSELTIKRRTNDGTESTVLRDIESCLGLTDLDGRCGVYLGAHECVFHNNHLYILVPIGRVEVDGSEISLSRQKAAGMVLYRCNVTAANPSLTVLDKWDFVHQAGCNLTVHDGSVHYVEHPPASQRFKPYNPDLESYNAEMGYNVLPESLGALKKIDASGEVEHLGNIWHTDRPYNIAQTRMLSIGDDLHLCAGYGNGDEVLRYNSLASGADNMVHIVYGKTLHYVLPRFQPSGSVYAALADIAKKVHATLSFEKNVVMITDRRPYRARVDGAIGTGTADLSFSDANKPFPSSGYLLVGKEILQYTGISGNTFTGIKRGVLGSAVVDQVPDDSEVLYLDNLIESEKLGSPYKAITLASDTNRIFNIIRDSGGVAEVRDEDSIALYGERPYTLELGLTRHEKAWIEEVFASYLAELKDLQHIVNIQVRPDFSLRLGQIVPFFYKDLIRAMRIVSVRYERRATHIKGRTL